jgi:hypothetical protein
MLLVEESPDKKENSPNASNDSDDTRKPVRIYIFLLAVIALAVLLFVAVWPNMDQDNSVIRSLTPEMRLMILVITGGLFGGALRSISGIVNIIGNKSGNEYLAFYVWKIFLGMPSAIIIYLIVRGIIISPNAPVSSINSIGTLFLSFLSGFFSNEFFEKLYLMFKPFLDKETVLEKKIEHISSALGIDILDNYLGYVCYEILGPDRQQQLGSELGYDLIPGRSYALIIYFQNTIPVSSNCDKIEISGGNDSKKVTFLIIPRFDTVSVEPREQTITFRADSNSDKVTFNFSVPLANTPSDFWIEILQKNRLVMSISPKINISNI